MKKIIWSLKQLLPFTYFSEYTTEGRREVAIWKMWMGRSYSINRWQICS